MRCREYEDYGKAAHQPYVSRDRLCPGEEGEGSIVCSIAVILRVLSL